MNNDKEIIQAVMKSIADITVGSSVLSPQTFARFVRVMQHKTTLLKEARFIPMESHRTEIDRIWFPGRILQEGTSALAGSDPDTARNSLIAQELVASVGLKDTIVRRNIERGNLENTILQLMGEAAGRDTEEYALFADDDIPDTTPTGGDKFLRLTNGWLKRAGNAIYGNYEDEDTDEIDTTVASGNSASAGDMTVRLTSKTNVDVGKFVRFGGRVNTQEFHEITAKDDHNGDTTVTLANPLKYDQPEGTVVHEIEGLPAFSPIDRYDWPVNMLDAMLAALPKQYLQNRTNFRYYVTYEVEKAYRDWLKKRQTALGDRAVTGSQETDYESIPVRYCPMLERAYEVAHLDGKGAGRCALLTDPDNTVWGVFHKVTVEPEREAKDRKTDFVLVLEGDADYEDENGAVVAFLDRPAPAPPA